VIRYKFQPQKKYTPLSVQVPAPCLLPFTVKQKTWKRKRFPMAFARKAWFAPQGAHWPHHHLFRRVRYVSLRTRFTFACLFVSCCIALQTQWRCNVLKSNYENSTNLVCMLSAGSRIATAENWNKSKRLIAVILKGLDSLTKMQIVESPDFFLLYRPF